MRIQPYNVPKPPPPRAKKAAEEYHEKNRKQGIQDPGAYKPVQVGQPISSTYILDEKSPSKPKEVEAKVSTERAPTGRRKPPPPRAKKVAEQYHEEMK